MSDLPSFAAAPETSSGLPTAPAMNNVNVPVEPSIGPSSTAATTEKTPSYLSRVLNTLSSPRKPQRAPSIPRPPLVQRIEDHPRGYPRLAAFQESNYSWKIYRRFGFLRGRLLLDRQIELAQLEEKLHTIDKEDSERSLTSTMSRTGTEGRTTKHAQRFKDLMNEIAEKLRAYDDLVLRAKLFTSLGSPHPQDQGSMCNEVNNQMPLVLSEVEYLQRTDDFISLGDDQEIGGWLDAAIGQVLDILPENIQSCFRTPEQRARTDAVEIRLRSPARMHLLVRTVLFATTMSLLIGPSAIRAVIPIHRGFEMVLISGFTAMFAALLHLSTNGQRHEIMVGTAIYCAVMVVLLSYTAPAVASSA